MPIAAAAGGMALPASIYLLATMGTEHTRGWGVPVATDVAFALAVLSLLGERVPARLEALTLALTAADDAGGVLVIAFVYSQSISWIALLVAAGILLLIILLVRFEIFGIYAPYVVLSVIFLVAVYESGVHTTIAGVVLGLCAPASGHVSRDRFFDHAGRLLDRGRVRHRSSGIRGRELGSACGTALRPRLARRGFGLRNISSCPPRVRSPKHLVLPAAGSVSETSRRARPGTEFGSRFRWRKRIIASYLLP